MKKSLAHLPVEKREDIRWLTQRIRELADVEMVILFGSYARGDWVEDWYKEDGAVYEYRSDYDFLVIVGKKLGQGPAMGLEGRLSDAILPKCEQFSVIAHDIKFINQQLDQNQYFFSDIKREGILLYDSGRFKLAKLRKPSPQERLQQAKEDFNYWMRMGYEFLEGSDSYLAKRRYRSAIFLLHQTTESFYHALLLVFTGYKPKIHDLEKLYHRTGGYDADLLPIFPQQPPEKKDLFEKLRRAYVEARYNKHFSVNRRELRYLRERVGLLQKVARRACRTKIAALAAEAAG